MNLKGGEMPNRSKASRPSRGVASFVVALALSTSGLAALAISAGMPGTEVRLAGGNAPVDPGALDPFDLSAQNSPRVVVNPRNPANLVVAARVDSPQFSCGLHVSFNGGARWSPATVPFPDGKEIGCFSPDVAFDAGGVLHVAFSSFAPVGGHGLVPDAVWVATSTDGGRTVGQPVQASGPLAFQVRMAADRNVPGRLYLTWVQASSTGGWGFASTGNPLLLARSDDGGRTWAQPVTVSPPDRQRAVAPTMAAGQSGALYLAYLDVKGDVLDYSGAHEGQGGDAYPGPWAIVVARSADGGSTWSEVEVDREVVPTQRFLVLFPPGPSIAVDGERVYVAFHDGRTGDSDVRLWRSADGGRGWSAGQRVNDTRIGDGTAQHLPQVGVAPDGRVDVAYYDRRADPANVLTEVSLQSSFDGGATFRPRLRLSDAGRAFDSQIGFGRDRGLTELGSSVGLVAADRGAMAMWADTRLGTPLTGKQNLARAIVEVSPPPPLRRPLQLAGGAAVVLGLTLLVAAISARRKRRPNNHRGDDRDVEATQPVASAGLPTRVGGPA